ncbi:response regulator [Reyranella sp.]|uniref:response regulator n=1 Tax=Reyranella sp. TaxID=1929291 RepID=UPI002731124E|nr:response regulator [Reyranella sp.]MDP2378615.1 response regulator [Reyranella sp.]
MSAQVVVIEDDEDLRTEIVEFLVRRDHRPTGCATLAEATAAMETMTPDAVISDINLPDGDGMNFCMNNAARFPAAMWLLMSGNADLLRLGNQLKGIDGEKPSFAMVEKPVPLRLLDRFVSGVSAARAPDQAAAVGVAAVSL